MAHPQLRVLRPPSLVFRPPGGTSNRGAEAPLVGRFKGMGFLREGGNRNPPSLRRPFGDFLAAQKVTRPGAKYPRIFDIHYYIRFCTILCDLTTLTGIL